MQKYVDVTVRIPVSNELTDEDVIDLATEVKTILKDYGSDVWIEDVKVVSAKLFTKE